jgi:hypothetical protein
VVLALLDGVAASMARRVWHDFRAGMHTADKVVRFNGNEN